MTPPDPPQDQPDRGPDQVAPFAAALEAEQRAFDQRRGTRIFVPLPDPLDPDDPGIDGAAWLRYGLPPRPTVPTARALWRDMVRGLRQVTPLPTRLTANQDMMMSSGVGYGPAEEGAAAELSMLRHGRIGSSFNWSGAALLARRGQRFVQVLAEWQVPGVSAGNGEGPFVCSTWIGIDGLRRWMTSMPQMGTAQVVGRTGSGKPATFAWWQWWLKGRGTQEPVFIAELAPDARVFCCVTRLPPQEPRAGDTGWAQFFFRVVGDGTAGSLELAPPGAEQAAANPEARGASAQWILERPTALRKSPNNAVQVGDLYPLPDFGVASSTRFAALLADAPDASIPNAEAAQAGELEAHSTLRTPRKLRMIERRKNPTRIAVIATPIEAQDGRVTVRYKR